MKKLIMLLMCTIFILMGCNIEKDIPNIVEKNNAIEEVTLNKCIDGDTAKFDINGEDKSVRFLFIDTPEYTKKKELYGFESSEFTCNLLSNADKIEIEYDGEKKDKYDRVLAWVWITKDEEKVLIQEKLAKNGFVKKFYDLGNYKYEDLIRKSINDIYNIFEK